MDRFALFPPIQNTLPTLTRGIVNQKKPENPITPKQPNYTSVLFGAGNPRPVLTAEEIARLAALREQAEAKRKALPAVVQLRYPINGDRIGPRQIEKVEGAIANHPLLQNIDYSLFGENEQRCLRQLAIVVQLLRDPAKKNVQYLAREALGAVADPHLRDALILPLVNNADKSVRSHSAMLGGSLSDPKQQVAVIRKVSKDPDEDEYRREIAAETAMNVTDPELRDSLIEELADDANEKVRLGAVRASVDMGDPQRRDALIQKLFYDPSGPVRYAAAVSRAEIIRRMQDPKKRDAEIEKCANGDPLRQLIAGLLLRDMADPELRDTLIEKFVDNRYNGTLAAKAVDLISNPQRRDAVIEKIVALGTNRRTIADHLVLHSNQQRAVALIEEWVNAPDPDINSGIPHHAAASAGNLRDPEVGIALTEKLANHSNDRVKEGATHAAAKLASRLNNPQRAIAVLEKIADNPDPNDGRHSRYEAGKAAGEIEKPALRDKMVQKFANHPHVRVRTGAAIAVAQVSDSNLRDSLIKQLANDPESAVRWALVNSIAALSDPQQANALIGKLANDSDDGVRMHVASMLSKTLIPDINRFHADVPFYVPLLKEALADLPGISLMDAMIVLSTLAASGRDGGELKTQVLPSFNKLLGFAKAESNKHLHPNQEPYTPQKIEALFAEHALDIMNLLAKVGERPLRFKLTQGMEKFAKFLESTRGLASQPELIALLRNISQRQAMPPYELTQLLEIASGFCLLGQTDKLVGSLKTMTRERQSIDLKRLGREYLESFAQVCELNATVDDQSFSSWNLSYMHALAEAYRGFDPDAKYVLQDLIEAALAGRFEAYMTDSNTPVGQANLKTKELYQENGLDISKWLHYDQTRAFTVGKSAGKNERTTFDSFMVELSGEIIKLMGSQKRNIQPLLADNDVRKALFRFVKSQGYAFDDNLQLASGQADRINKRNMAQFTGQLLSFLDKQQVWANAQAKRQTDILTIKHHLEQLKNKFENASDAAPTAQNFMIRTWTRNPGYDLFQGNYTQCCIAVDQVNRSAIVDYLTTHAIQIVEIIDLDNNKTVANTFAYWEKDPNGKPSLVADDMEVAAQYRGRIATQFRDELAEYLKDYGRAVAKRNVPVLLGKNYNAVPTEDLPQRTLQAQFIGATPSGQLYLDSLGSKWTDITKPHKANFFVL